MQNSVPLSYSLTLSLHIMYLEINDSIFRKIVIPGKCTTGFEVEEILKTINNVRNQVIY